MMNKMNRQLLWQNRAEIARCLRQHQIEFGPDGARLSNGSGLNVIGSFWHHTFNNDVEFQGNIFVKEGLIYLLNSAFAGQSAIANWYLALFGTNYTPDEDLTAATFPGVAGELTTEITAATRPAWSRTAATTDPEVSNTGSEAIFTYAAGGPYTVYGVALLSASGKGATTGKCAAATRFEVTRSGQLAGDRLGIGYALGAADDS